jgi:hypothetical protein
MPEIIIVNKKFRLQDVETVELGEQIGGGVRRRAERVAGMLAFACGEGLVGFVELEVIHLLETEIDGRRRRGQISRHHDRE